MLPKACVSAPVFAPLGDAMLGGAEDGDETVFQLDRGTELLAHLIQPNLGHVGPDAQDVGYVGDVDGHSNTT